MDASGGWPPCAHAVSCAWPVVAPASMSSAQADAFGVTASYFSKPYFLHTSTILFHCNGQAGQDPASILVAELERDGFGGQTIRQTRNGLDDQIQRVAVDAMSNRSQ